MKNLSVLIIALIFLLASCSKNKENQNNSNQKRSNFVSPLAYSGASKINDTIYYSSNKGKKAYLNYYDINGGNKGILCSKPECDHVVNEKLDYSVNNYCNGFIGEVDGSSSNSLICSDEKYIYSVAVNDNALCIVRFNLDGSARDKIAVVGKYLDDAPGSTGAIISSFLVHDDYIYLSINKAVLKVDGDNSSYVYRVDKKVYRCKKEINSKVEIILDEDEFEEEKTYFYLKYNEFIDKIFYLQRFSLQEGYRTRVLIKKDDHSLEEIGTFDVLTTTFSPTQEGFAFIDQNNNVCLYSLESKQIKTIPLKNVEKRGHGTFLDKFFIANSFTDKSFHVFNHDGELLNTIIYETKLDWDIDYVGLLGADGDRVYALIEYGDKSLTDPKELVYSIKAVTHINPQNEKEKEWHVLD